MSESGTPFISVVIPLYNKAPHIARALESVRAQTFEDYEIIVVDDGSTDGGGEIASRYLTARDRLIRQENAGVSAARNAGIEAARSELIAFLDADDEWLSDHLEHLVELCHRFPEAALLSTGHFVVCEDGLTLEHKILGSEPILLDTCEWFGMSYPGLMIPYASSCAVRKTAVQAVGGFPLDVRFMEDGHLWCRLALRFPFALHPAVSSVYYLGTANQGTVLYRWEKRLPAYAEMMLQKLQACEVPREAQPSVARYVAEAICEHIFRGIERAQYEAARQAFQQIAGDASILVARSARLRRLRVALRCVPGPLLKLYVRLSRSRLSLWRPIVRNGTVRRVVARPPWPTLVTRVVVSAFSRIRQRAEGRNEAQ